MVLLTEKGGRGLDSGYSFSKLVHFHLLLFFCDYSILFS